MRTSTWNVILAAMPEPELNAPLLASQIARRAEVATGTARRYLEEMERRGLVFGTATGSGRFYRRSEAQR